MLSKDDVLSAVKQGYKSIAEIPQIRFQLAYATIDNFMSKDVYGPHWQALCHVSCFEKLLKAQEVLKKEHSHLGILVFDALRPVRVQQVLFDFVKGTEQESYVANPQKGSMHSYGMALDLTLYDLASGREMDMGTPFDDFTELSQPQKENEFLSRGLLSREVLHHRHILRDTMLEAGFLSIPNEWWHFNAEKPEVVRQDYQVFP